MKPSHITQLLEQTARKLGRLRRALGIGLVYRGRLAAALDATPPPEAPIVAGWVESYLAQPHPHLGRRGPVCPFVPKALRSGRLRTIFHPELDGTQPELIEDLLLSHSAGLLQRFPLLGPEDEFHSLLVVLPGIPPERGHVVEQIHTSLKSLLMSRGVMVASFHPRSIKGGIRNEGFPAYGAPYPCFAVRHMGIHDIIFLGHNRKAFCEYRRRFGRRFDQGEIGDEHGYLTLYREACQRFR